METAFLMTVPGRSPRAAAPRLPALDAVRVVTVLTVIWVHSLSMMVPEDAGAAGALLVVFHSSREVFLLLSALVLTYTAGEKVVAGAFWRRRFPLIAAPYAAWSAIYLLSDGDLGSPTSLLARYGRDLLTGAARYHLYFVLLTFQLYLVFPWLLRWVRAREGRLAGLVGTSVAVQLAFTAAIHYHLPLPPPLSWLADHPDDWLPSYQLYVLAGIVVALHLDAVTRWCAGHLRLLAATAGAAVAGAVTWYLLALHAGTAPVAAAAVFQPAVVVESLALAALELSLAARWAPRAGARSLAVVAAGADVSFGVYLCHPLLLELATNAGIATALSHLPAGAAVAVVVAVFAPVVLAVAVAGITLVRRTPLSLWLTGRRPTGAGRAVRAPLRASTAGEASRAVAQ